MLTMLQMLPEGSKLGFKTSDGFFVPLNLNNLQVQLGAAEKLADAAVTNFLPGSFSTFFLVLGI